VEIRKNGDTIWVELVDDLSFTNSHRIKERILKYVDHDIKVLILNMSKVNFMDSAGIGLLISLLKKMKSNGGKLIVEYPKLGVQKLLEMTKLDELMEIKKKPEPTTGSWDDFEN